MQFSMHGILKLALTVEYKIIYPHSSTVLLGVIPPGNNNCKQFSTFVCCFGTSLHLLVLSISGCWSTVYFERNPYRDSNLRT